jgi:hypothetical protein
MQVIDNASNGATETSTDIPANIPGYPMACNFMGLGWRTCRWPLWDYTGHVPFHEQFYCGDESLWPGAPYCAEHARQSFVPSRAPTRGRLLLSGSGA